MIIWMFTLFGETWTGLLICGKQGLVMKKSQRKINSNYLQVWNMRHKKVENTLEHDWAKKNIKQKFR